MERDWSPAIMEQCEARCHRIGQQSTVNIYSLVSHFDIEEVQTELLKAKGGVIEKIIDGSAKAYRVDTLNRLLGNSLS